MILEDSEHRPNDITKYISYNIIGSNLFYYYQYGKLN